MTMTEWIEEQFENSSSLEEFYRTLIDAGDILAEAQMDGFAIHGIDLFALENEMQEERKLKG